MVKAENISTFAKLISIVQYILKQMILKYFYRSVGILLWVLMLSSCLDSNTTQIDQSKDAQIYSFSLTSATDSNNYFNDVKFSIDQIKGQIFNRDSLPYLFDVDSVMVSISSGQSALFSNITFNLRDSDSTYTWNSKDSVATHRLKSIETTAEDGKTKMKYDIKINIHQQDPYIINWDLMASDYFNASPIESQKTILMGDKFITYYKSMGQVRASAANIESAGVWGPVVVAGLPAVVDLLSIVSIESENSSIVYVLDNNKKVYASTDGMLWSEVDADYTVEAIYGNLPFITGEYATLVAINVDGDIKFATTTDFSSFDIMNNIPAGMPLSGFSAESLNNPSVYSAKYIILYGGVDVEGKTNKKIWIVQNKDEDIKTIAESLPMEVDDAQLFLYDEKVYIMVSEGGENKLYSSKNYGLNWTSDGENQSVAEEMSFRRGASVISDSDNFIWIFGGKSINQSQIVDAWRGRLNKLAK